MVSSRRGSARTSKKQTKLHVGDTGKIASATKGSSAQSKDNDKTDTAEIIVPPSSAAADGEDQADQVKDKPPQRRRAPGKVASKSRSGSRKQTARGGRSSSTQKATTADSSDTDSDGKESSSEERDADSDEDFVPPKQNERPGLSSKSKYAVHPGNSLRDSDDEVVLDVEHSDVVPPKKTTAKGVNKTADVEKGVVKKKTADAEKDVVKTKVNRAEKTHDGGKVQEHTASANKSAEKTSTSIRCASHVAPEDGGDVDDIEKVRQLDDGVVDKVASTSRKRMWEPEYAPSGTVDKHPRKKQAVMEQPSRDTGPDSGLDGNLVEAMMELASTVRSMDKKLDSVVEEIRAFRDGRAASASRPSVAVGVKEEVTEGGEQKPVRVVKVKRERANVKMYKQRMAKEAGLVDVVTATTCLEHAIVHSVVVELVHECKQTLVLEVDAFMRVLSIMLTAPKRGKVADIYTPHSDRIQSFFERLVRRTIRMAEENTLDLFNRATVPKVEPKRNETATGDADAEQPAHGEKAHGESASRKPDKHGENESGTRRDDVTKEAKNVKNKKGDEAEDPRPDPPAWLIPDGQVRFISRQHITDARKLDEVGGKKETTTRRGEIALGVTEPSKDDIAVYTCGVIFSKHTGFLNDGRKAVQRAFFDQFGHLFSTWMTIEANYGIKQSELRMVWSSPMSRATIVPMSEISAMIVKECGSSNADATNNEKFCELMDRTPELVLLVTHDVIVNYGANEGRKKEPFPHHIHLMEVAVRILAGFVQMKKKGRQAIEVLAMHKSTLAVVYQIAVTLRMVFTNQTVHLQGACPVRVEAHEKDDVVPVDTNVAEVILNKLNPPASVMTCALPSILACMPVASYKDRCIRPDKPPEQQEGESRKSLLPAAPIPDDDATLDLELKN